jgi:virulence factor Mce-like protein
VTTQQATRAFAVGAFLLGIVGLLAVLLMGGSSYTIHARFLDAQGIVTGGEVEVAGRTVGSISAITVTPSGDADVKLSISDGSLAPLHVGTRASIRAVGQATITGHYLLLTPGPSNAPVLPDNGVLPITQTSGIVPIDALLDSFGPAQRRNLDLLIANSAQVYAGSGARYFNEMLGRLDPALGQIEGFTSDLALDRGALGELVQRGSVAASAMASQSSALTSAVTHTARALTAIANQRAALADLLSRMSPVLGQARGTLRGTAAALTALRPALRDILPVSGPLNAYLRKVDVVLPEAAPVLATLRSELPPLNQSLGGVRSLAGPAVRAFDTLGPAMKGLAPIFQGLRFYSTDLVLGALSGLFGIATGEYIASGHYTKANFVQSAQTAALGPLSAVLAAHPLVPGLLATRTELNRRCPGGNQPPAPDGSSPWNLGPQFCTPANDEPLSVDFP